MIQELFGQTLSDHLYGIRKKHPALLRLQDLVSVRRGARGAGGALEPLDQLLLSELIYDLALGLSSSSVAGTSDVSAPAVPSPRRV
jgi:hypothetical protein